MIFTVFDPDSVLGRQPEFLFLAEFHASEAANEEAFAEEATKAAKEEAEAAKEEAERIEREIAEASGSTEKEWISYPTVHRTKVPHSL